MPRKWVVPGEGQQVLTYWERQTSFDFGHSKDALLESTSKCRIKDRAKQHLVGDVEEASGPTNLSLFSGNLVEPVGQPKRARERATYKLLQSLKFRTLFFGSSKLEQQCTEIHPEPAREPLQQENL